MKAIVKAAPGPGLVVRDVPKPVCGPSDVLIRVHHAGVCGTDLHIADWNPWAEARVKPPVTLGHEFAGEIVEVGSEVHEDFKRGELVTAEGHIICGHCLQCRTGNGHVCQRTSIIGVDRNGAFAEYHAMPAGNVMRLDGIPAEIGAIMDPMGNAFHTVLSTDVSGSVVLILGCGPIGCFAVGIAKAAGAAAVIAVDVNARAPRAGAEDGRHARPQPEEGRRGRGGARAVEGRRRRPGVRDVGSAERAALGLQAGAARRPGAPPRHPRRHGARSTSPTRSSSRGSRSTASSGAGCTRPGT